MAKKTPRKRGRPQGRRTVPLSLRVPPAIKEALEELHRRTRRPVTTEVVMAIEKHLAAEGLWPPPAPQEDAE